MNIAIVGAGSIGIASKLLLNSRDIPSKLFEATSNIGGILRDVSYDKDTFFSGCQYIDNNNSFHQILPNSELINYTYRYASYTDIFEEIGISNEFAGPTINKFVKLFSPRNIDLLNISIEEKIDEYPDIIKVNLKKWLLQIGIEPSKMHHNSLHGLVAGRIYLPNQINDILQIRTRNPSASNFYGLLYINHTKFDSFFLPHYGFSNYFDTQVLPSITQDFYPNSSLKINKINNNFNLLGADLNDTFTKILWTANPNPILKCLNLPRLDSHNLRCNLIVGEIDQAIDNPMFIQVFSQKSNILRIYIYKINGKHCFTIEKIDDGETLNQSLKFTKKLLSYFGIHTSLRVRGVKNQNRFVLLTLDDYAQLTKLNNILLGTNMISAGWHIYGRGAKIKFISKQINNLN